MDPQACWNEIKALLAENFENRQEDKFAARWELDEKLMNLAEWIRKGGFWPKP